MSKAEKHVVNKAAKKIASTISKVLDTVKKQGNIVTQCVSVVASAYKGEDVPREDLKVIAENVARVQKWNAKSAGPRMSEVRKIVRNYKTIPEAITAFNKKNGGVTWHEAMRLLTQLNKGLTVNQSVKAMVTRAEVPKVKADKQIAALLTRISNVETRSPKIIAFRKALSALAAKHNL